MSKTFDDYVDLVQNEADTTATIETNIIKQHIKEIYNDILKEAYKYLVGTTTEDQLTVANQSAYTVTNGFLEVYKVFYKDNNNWDELTQISEVDYLENYINDNSSTPQYYYLKAFSVYVVPAPSTATGQIRIVYTKIPDELTTGSTSLIPDRYTDVVKIGAMYKWMAYERDPASEIMERRYLNAKYRMITELATKGETLRPKIFNRRRFNTNYMR